MLGMRREACQCIQSLWGALSPWPPFLTSSGAAWLQLRVSGQVAVLVLVPPPLPVGP